MTAKELRAKGLTYQEIALKLGCSKSKAYEACNPGYQREKSKRWRESHPEKVREENAKRSKYKREWEMGECPQCGSYFPGAKRRDRPESLCRPCRDDENKRAFKARAWRFIELREQGMLNYEIERREGLSFNTVASTLYRAKTFYGLDVPPSPYRRNGR